MSNVFEDIQNSAKALRIDVFATDVATFVEEKEFDNNQLQAIAELFRHLKERKEETIVSTLLRMSRLPLKEPKTFQGFDFAYIRTKDVDKLKSLPTLATLHANRNLAFIGPQGVGKTHLAMAYGRECCLQGYKTYFLKATELNQRFSEAIKYGREGSVINGLVKPSCLVIDEIGRCVFNKENTRLFFDMVDRRYSKEGPNSMVFTSNLMPDKWCEFFNEGTIHAVQFYGGITKYFVPDNLKAAVTKHSKDELVLQSVYSDLEDFYDTIVLPPPPRKPRGKATVENHVRYLETHLIEPLRTVKYIRANTLLQQSEKARKTNSSYEYTNEMSAYDLLVIDDFGLMELDLDKCRDLFEIIETRDSRKATMIVSQLPVANWWDLFKDSTYADACLSRMTAKAYRLECNGRDMRKTE